ncbi:MAG: sigma factor [Methylococcales bacterium]
MLFKRSLIVLAAVLLSVRPDFAAEPDWSGYAGLLRDHVSPGSMHGTDLAIVDYRVLKEKGALEAVYQVIRLHQRDNLNHGSDRSAEENLSAGCDRFDMSGESIPQPTQPPYARNRSKLAEWLDLYGDARYRYAMVRLHDGQLAEDLVQETLLAGLNARDRFAGNAAEKTG